MNTFKLYATMLLIAFCTILAACSKDDEPKQNNDNSIEKYYSLIYGSWYRESKTDISQSFMSYKFYTNKTVVRYYKSARRRKIISDGNSIYYDWKVDKEESTMGIWLLEEEGGLAYLKQKWDRNDFYYRESINYISPSLFHFEDGYASDLNKGDKNPDF